MDFIEKQATDFPDQKSEFNEIGELFQKKLWHQLGCKLDDVVKIEFFQQDKHLLNLFQKFVSKYKINLNPLKFTEFAIAASGQYTDVKECLEFLESIEMKDHEQPDLLLRMEKARKYIELKNYDEAKKMIDDGRKTIDQCMAVMEPAIHSHFYLASLEYFQAVGPATDFYKNSLLYLTYTPLSSISQAKQIRLAADITLAALVGHHIYNFGELLQHAVVNVLETTEHAWLKDLLCAFNIGDIAVFKKIFDQNKGAQVVLQENESFLGQKIRIMALIEMVFQRKSQNRLLKFTEVAEACDLDVSQVELLLMKACSLGVAKGEIDQVEGTVRVQWVQPRVLSTTQLSSIKDKLSEWSAKVKTTAQYLEENAPELLQGFA